MEKRIKWELGVDINLPSYVYDIHLEIYDWKEKGTRIEESEGDDNGAEELIERTNKVLKEVAEESCHGYKWNFRLDGHSRDSILLLQQGSTLAGES